VIPINDHIRIAVDKVAWMIQKPEKEKGDIVWKACSYYPKLSQCFDAVMQMNLAEEDILTAKEVAAAWDRGICALDSWIESGPVSDTIRRADQCINYDNDSLDDGD